MCLLLQTLILGVISAVLWNCPNPSVESWTHTQTRRRNIVLGPCSLHASSSGASCLFQWTLLFLSGGDGENTGYKKGPQHQQQCSECRMGLLSRNIWGKEGTQVCPQVCSSAVKEDSFCALVMGDHRGIQGSQGNLRNHADMRIILWDYIMGDLGGS